MERLEIVSCKGSGGILRVLAGNVAEKRLKQGPGKIVRDMNLGVSSKWPRVGEGPGPRGSLITSKAKRLLIHDLVISKKKKLTHMSVAPGMPAKVPIRMPVNATVPTN